MTGAAIANGLYLRPLDREETAALMAEIVIEHDVALKRYRDVVAVADVVLRHYPGSVDAMLNRGSAYGALAAQANPLSFAYGRDMAENRAAFARAETLGWREPDSSALASR